TGDLGSCTGACPVGKPASDFRNMRQECFMLPSQRALFDVPAEVAYLNAASFSPLPRATQEAARAAVARKGQPWKIGPEFADTQHERARAAAAALIGADPRDVALVSSVGYGVAIAGKVLKIARGSRVLVLAN